MIGAVEAADFLLHHEALGYVLRHEPERVLPAFAFQRFDGALAIATGFVTPHLARFVPDPGAPPTAPSSSSACCSPSPIDPSPMVDLTDPDQRAPVRAHVRPPCPDRHRAFP